MKYWIAFSDFRRKLRSRQFLKSAWTRIIKAWHGNFLTLNLHANIVNVNAEKMMYSVFIMRSPPIMPHQHLAMRRLTAVSPQYMRRIISLVGLTLMPSRFRQRNILEATSQHIVFCQ